MRHAKKIATTLLVGFMVFAPPGTLIFLSLLVASFFGKKVLIIVGVLGVSVLLLAMIKRRTSINVESAEKTEID
jgi:hypothetical protein